MSNEQMKISVYSQSGEKIEELTLSEAFDVKASSASVTLYINYLRNSLRAPIANTKDRSAVSGGGKKPYKQKGTGNARAGSSRSPLWVGGGVTFGPKSDQNWKTRINSRERKRVILAIIAEFFKDNKALVVDDLSIDAPKTKKADEILNKIKAEGKISLITVTDDKNAAASFRNIAGVFAMSPNRLDMLNLISSNHMVLSKKALEELEIVYTTKQSVG